MRIAYLINQYPKISHSFIRREILALEQSGAEIMRISLRGWDIELADEEDRTERALTRYVLRAPVSTFLLAVGLMLFHRPIRLLRALGMAWHMSRGSQRPFYVHLIYVAEACRIEPWLRTANIRHLHAHFGTNSAEVAMFVHLLGGPHWSFTMHGPEDFEHAAALHLADKVDDCTFAAVVCWFGRAQMLLALKPQNWRKLHVVECGLDSEFGNEPATTEALPRRFVCVARISAEKGHFILLEAALLLAAQGVDFKLILAGDGPLRSQIEAQIAQHNLADKVQLTGWLSGKQVRDEIRAARALVLPSLAEGLPTVIMEAMALRRPVISTFVAGIPELVLPGENGWLVPASDAVALAGAMRNCLEAPAEVITRMGEAARDRALERHDVNRQAAKLQKLFDLAANNSMIPEKSGMQFVQPAAD